MYDLCMVNKGRNTMLIFFKFWMYRMGLILPVHSWVVHTVYNEWNTRKCWTCLARLFFHYWCCVLLRNNFTDSRYIFLNSLPVLLVPYSNVKDIHIKSALQIMYAYVWVVLIEHTCIARTDNIFMFSLIQTQNVFILLCVFMSRCLILVRKI